MNARQRRAERRSVVRNMRALIDGSNRHAIRIPLSDNARSAVQAAGLWRVELTDEEAAALDAAGLHDPFKP